MEHDSDPYKEVKGKIYEAISKVLTKYDMQLRRCGARTYESPKLDEGKGCWENPADVTNKPPRWLVQIKKDKETVVASVPEMLGNDRLAHLNTANGRVGGVFIRVVPAMRRSDGKFDLYDQWEWTLFFAFGATLEPGSAAQLLDGFNPKSGTLKYKGKSQPYVVAQLFGLCDPDAEWKDPESSEVVTYREASNAIRELIQVNVPKLDDASADNQ